MRLHFPARDTSASLLRADEHEERALLLLLVCRRDKKMEMPARGYSAFGSLCTSSVREQDRGQKFDTPCV